MRLNVQACGFWEREQAWGYLNKLLQQYHVMSENNKKKVYNERVLQVDHLHHWFFPLTEVWVENVTNYNSSY